MHAIKLLPPEEHTTVYRGMKIEYEKLGEYYKVGKNCQFSGFTSTSNVLKVCMG